MALGEIETKILQALKDVYDNRPNKHGGLDYQKLANKTGLDAQILELKYCPSLKNAGYIENTPTIKTFIRISQKGIDYLDNKKNNKRSRIRWFMEHFWVPLLVALIAGFILLYFQPWQYNIQDNKTERKATP